VTIQSSLFDDTFVAAHRSYDWLRKHIAFVDATSPHELSRALEWLIAAWICEQAFDLGTSGRLSQEGALQIARRLNGQERSQAFTELFTCDALRVVLAHTIASRHGVGCEGLAAFVGGLVASLPQPGHDAAADDDLFETRLIIALTGLGQMPRLPSLDTLLDIGILDLLNADQPAIHRVAGQVMAASAYGTREPVVGVPLRQRLIQVMSVWLLDFARGYRLDSVALVMRSLASLGESLAVHDASRFLLAQHHPSGHFGFFGPEAAHANQLSPTWDEVASLQLPVTFACLWALSECNDHGFRLLTNARAPVSNAARKG
jgi:hypothetical protein